MKREERQILEALHKAIGYNLQQQRLQLGVGALEIELATQVDAPTLKAYEKGEKAVPVIDLVKLSQFFGVAPGLLFEGVPVLVQPASPPLGYGGFSDAHIEEFQQNFLKVTGPARGDKFKRLLKKISDEDPDNADDNGSRH